MVRSNNLLALHKSMKMANYFSIRTKKYETSIVIVQSFVVSLIKHMLDKTSNNSAALGTLQHTVGVISAKLWILDILSEQQRGQR